MSAMSPSDPSSKAEIAMAEIEVIANANAMDRFAENEGMKNRTAEVISMAYYARYPMAELHPFLAQSLYSSPGHDKIFGMTENNMERETEIAARITGDKLLAIPMREVAAEIRERASKISPERQIELTKQYAKDLGIHTPHQPAELGPPTSALKAPDPALVAFLNNPANDEPPAFSATVEKALKEPSEDPPEE